MTAELRGEFASKEDLRSFATKEDAARRGCGDGGAAPHRTREQGGPPRFCHEGGPRPVRRRKDLRQFAKTEDVAAGFAGMREYIDFYLPVHTRRVTDTLR